MQPDWQKGPGIDNGSDPRMGLRAWLLNRGGAYRGFDALESGTTAHR